jgi:hypothetical protein
LVDNLDATVGNWPDGAIGTAVDFHALSSQWGFLSRPANAMERHSTVLAQLFSNVSFKAIRLFKKLRCPLSQDWPNSIVTPYHSLSRLAFL